MVLRTAIIKDRYYDSVFLMSLASSLKALDGVSDASAMMGTDANKALLKESEMLDEAAQAAAPADLVVSVIAETEEAAQIALDTLEAKLEGDDETPGAHAKHQEQAPATLNEAIRLNPEAGIAQLSIPGLYVRHEALKAMDLGLHPFVFSDNVSVEDEILLKDTGRERGLLVMGPDCGTSILNGVALGFANVVPRGPVGIVGASGTGIQELTTLLARAGVGTHQAIGVGGRDLSLEIGARSMLQGLEVLDQDPKAELIVLVSKPPHPEVAQKVLARAKAVKTPCIICFLGGDPAQAKPFGLPFTGRLDVAAQMCQTLLDGGDAAAVTPAPLSEEWLSKAKAAAAKLQPKQRFVRGLYSGGTLCDEALQIAEHAELPELHCNLHSEGPLALEKPDQSVGNTFLDMGDDTFTQGRPHPMIDFTARAERFLFEADDPETALILFDVVIGYGSHDDPAAALKDALTTLAKKPNDPLLVASVTGTDQDPQSYTKQRRALEALGVTVLENNAMAATYSAAIIQAKEASA